MDMPAFDAEIQLIRDAIKRSAEAGRAFKFERHTPESEVRRWEDLHQVRLPEQYRVLLREFGDGGSMKGSYCDFILFHLGEWSGLDTATEPFPVTREQLRMRLRQVNKNNRLTVSSLYDEGILFPELAVYPDREEMPPGCVVFSTYPSDDSVYFVTTGDLAGSVWCDVNGGIPEVDESREPTGILRWFAESVVEVMKTPD